ncbi:MAG: RNA-binding transcriptional accessory protein [Clostridia bacterium]|nr:RNA-binding transcriptional accessory protein [Clostridia bacterium]
MTIIEHLTNEFHLRPAQVENTVALIDEGNTIPFIARYRKEVTGSLDDQVLRELHERLLYLRNLEEQREKIRASLQEQDVLGEELETALDAAMTLTDLEDVYRPYRPKRKTRASVARAKGLQPLADALYAQPKTGEDPETLAAAYLTEDVATIEEALQGASDIIAEQISDEAGGRKRLRVVCMNNGNLSTKATGDDLGVYEMYKEYTEPLKRIPGHRILAVNRGEREEFLKVSVECDRARSMFVLSSIHIREGSVYEEFVRNAMEDAYDRLIFPSIERELRNELTDKASTAAIKVFASNLRQLLMQPPVKGRVALGLDPGYRTGCKVAVVDQTGKVLDTGVIYPVPPHNKLEQAKSLVRRMIETYGVQVIAIGNGTASHETEVFVADLLREMATGDVSYMVVSEAGASVYSASKLAAAEFPEFDVSLRSAVSIARRLQDPLAELVKIDPQAIGVGQYQHDMPAAQLADALDGVVESCVNAVGVDLNTASAPLLSRVAGIGGALAKNIVAYREENGAFQTRATLKKVPKLGPKAFQQCAGFLRVTDGKVMLDATAVHPESYAAAEQLLSLCGYTEADVRGGHVADLHERAEAQGLESLAQTLGIGVPTLQDIIAELQRPGRDPRDELPPPLLRTDVMDMNDLKVGMELKGTVRNVIDFGAFVDIGVHQDGLVHISKITDRFIRHPSEVLKVGDVVTVWVEGVDSAKKRISLTMKKPKD